MTSLNKKKIKWQCFDCDSVFKTKRELVEHVADELDEIGQTEETLINQIDEMGIKNPYTYLNDHQ